VVPELADEQPAAGLGRAGQVGRGLDRAGADLEQPVRHVDEEPRELVLAQPGEQRTGRPGRRAQLVVELAGNTINQRAVGPQHPRGLGVEGLQAGVEVDGRPRRIAGLHEGEHLVPVGIVRGEIAQRLAVQDEHPFEQIAAFTPQIVEHQFRLMQVRGAQQPRGHTETKQQQTEHDGEAGFGVHRAT